MKRWILGLVAAIGVSLIGGATASAQGFGCGGNGGYGGYGGGYGGYGYSAGYGGYASPGYGGYGGWHNTSHFDYHPGSSQRHRMNYHYAPRHNDYHRSGHRH